MPQTKLKLLDLFSGLGGFSLGLESTGFFETIAFVEKDEFCQKVLKKNFKNIPIEGDIRNVKGDRYKAEMSLLGDFPCQPFSVAGKRKGTDDDRYLWDETIRVVRECKPKWFIGENVEGLINIQEGMVLRQVQDDLEKEGFQVQCLIIPASGIGAWHQRKRIWIIGYNVSNSNTRFSIKRTKKYKQGGTPLPMAVKMFPDTFGKLSDGCSSTTRNSKAKFKRMECNQSWNWNEVRSKTERCSEQDREDVSNSKGWSRNKLSELERSSEHNIRNVVNKQKLGGKLNPTFVEFLMGYPMNWTKIEPTESKLLETQSFHKSQENLEKQSLKPENVSDSDINGHK